MNILHKDRQLNDDEIQELYDFVKQHYVEYYDLQIKLVEKLANGIEQRWRTEPQLPFKENLTLEFRKFGVFGFTEIVEHEEKKMTKIYGQLIYKECVRQFSKPLIFIPSILSIAVLTYFHSELITNILLILLLGQCLYFFIKSYRLKKHLKHQQKIYLLERLIINGSGFSTGSIYVFLLITHFFDLKINSFGQVAIHLICNLCIVIIFVMNYVVLYQLPSKKSDLLTKIYPERLLKTDASNVDK